MSRSPSPAPLDALFRQLMDDAAVFPPAARSLPDAVHAHLARRDTPEAPWVGPLLVPATSAAEVASLAAADPRSAEEPLAVGLIVRPGADTSPLTAAVEALRDDPHVLVTGTEVGATAPWRELLALQLPLAVEVGSGPEAQRQLDEVAAAIDEDHDVTAKFRTGATPSWPWPDEQALAAFLDAGLVRGLPFKLTGGLHQALRGSYQVAPGSRPEPMHGLVNVLVATHVGLAGAEADELAEVLASHDAERLVETLAALSPEAIDDLRSSFTSFGCCEVLDPIHDLRALGLLHQE